MEGTVTISIKDFEKLNQTIKDKEEYICKISSALKYIHGASIDGLIEAWTSGKNAELKSRIPRY